MLNGLIRSTKQDAARVATRGALMVYAGLFAAMASLFVTVAIVISLTPLVGQGLAVLCGGIFLLLLAGVFFFAAQALSGDHASPAQVRSAKASSAPPSSGGTNYEALLMNGLASGLLEKQFKEHPVRTVAAAVAAGTVMGMMEARGSD
ncbi:phage holin family protein [Aquisalinus flavus]|uniref:Uncharacterized protein n=1 Tax=Aquisalinus flavus TaxID=1526572 RepID=A0A8J2V228_9PROT|nr:phage holin family protein [Aquisalinus flavus]MBD0427033.1 phage holin family protein [Aquisalinus flavus]UNE46859.1 phage holin family protein [Aquisalinus flavus]GGC97832.1 hypothetical protein GCM10011342_03470 [Aquisalinus flavus]